MRSLSASTRWLAHRHSPGKRYFALTAASRNNAGHLQESGTENRLLFEIRVIDGRWCLDSYGHSGDAQQALMNRNSLHALGAWYHVAAVYDGNQFRNYVNGTLEGAADIRFAPQGPGRSSIGVRINRVNYFKGAIHLARFTRRALAPAEFLAVP